LSIELITDDTSSQGDMMIKIMIATM
jgi:hypothetical protein